MDRQNINYIYKNGLCHFCGVCYGVCPKNNIHFKPDEKGNPIFRVKNETRCGSCNLCIRVCPGLDVDFLSLHRSIFSSEYYFGFLGSFVDCALAHSRDSVLRRRGASGGVVSSLLISALELGQIDGATVVTLGLHGNPFEPTPFIARTKDEILSASGSKYLTVPVGMVLREIWQSSKEERYAFVGLPCHVHGLRKAQRYVPRLGRRVGPVISLFCGMGSSPLATEVLLKRIGVNRDDVASIDYRYGKWPGGFAATLKSGQVIWVPLDEYMSIMKIYQNIRCIMCADHTGEFADLSIGDAWLDEFKGQEGLNVVIIRTIEGKKLLIAAQQNENLDYSPINPEKVVDSQKLALYDKKIKIFASFKIARRFGLSNTIPRYTGLNPFQKAGFREYFRAIVFMVVPRMAAAKGLKHLFLLILRLPKGCLKMHFKGKHKKVKEAVLESSQ